MEEMLTISLHDLKFFAYHGLYPEERKTGNEFKMHLSVSFPAISNHITRLEDTINYASLYELVTEEMTRPRDLLETFVMELAEKIHQQYPMVKSVDLRIEKLHLPIPRFTGHVSVAYSRSF
jgi:7,8-dihydroneopterin aldolase/epimerase/oxygenase